MTFFTIKHRLSCNFVFMKSLANISIVNNVIKFFFLRFLMQEFFENTQFSVIQMVFNALEMYCSCHSFVMGFLKKAFFTVL